MRDQTYTDEQIVLAQRMHLGGLYREWQPGDRLIGGERPVRVVRSVSVEGEPLVEVERGGRLQTVGVAHPRIWLPTVSDILEMMSERAYEGALMFRASRYGIKFRAVEHSADYRLITGDAPRTVAYRAMVFLIEEGLASTEAVEGLEAPQ